MAALSCSAAFVSGDPAPSSLARRTLLSSGVAPPRTVALRAAHEAAAEGKRRPRGITKPRPISPELQALLGVEEIPRTQALKVIWAYIKENNLQDPEN